MVLNSVIVRSVVLRMVSSCCFDVLMVLRVLVADVKDCVCGAAAAAAAARVVDCYADVVNTWST